MSASVLISIRPKWCELIASGKKTVEVRKTRPRKETPFKCYIYCTKSTDHPAGWLGCYDHDWHKFGLISPLNIEAGKHFNIEVISGKVVGEFVCDKIYTIEAIGPLPWGGSKGSWSPFNPNDACLTVNEIEDYIDGRDGFGWHISNLTIYEKPKKLHEFNGICSKKALKDCECGTCERLLKSGIGHCPMDFLKRPPQSWCYVEEA